MIPISTNFGQSVNKLITMKRRKFLRQLGYSLPSALLLQSILTSCGDKGSDEEPQEIQPVNKFKDYTVVIVGAGAAGLYSGWYLHERGFNVKILEASSRVGGRVRSLSGFADFDVELGAEKIQGNLTEWYRIAVEQVGAKLNDTAKEDYFFFKEDLGSMTEPPVKSKSVAGGYAEFVKTMQFVDNAPLYTGEDKTVEQVFSTSGISWNMFGVANGLLGNKHGTSNNRLSLKGLAEEESLWTAGDESYTLKDMSLLEVMETKFAPILNKVVMNAAVKKIDYTGDKVVLTDQLNKTYQADRVIITVPLPILKDGDITFVPALPSTKVDAYSNIGMGGGIKAVFKFSQAFWETLTSDKLGSVIGYNELPELWATAVGKGTNSPILTAQVMGEKGEQFSSMSTSDAKGFLLGHLDNIFGNNTASQSILQDGFHLMDWGKEPYIRGSYSYPMVGGGLIFRKELAESVDDKLFFAGEATHFKGHSGTVHGAIETAIRAKDELEATIL